MVTGSESAHGLFSFVQCAKDFSEYTSIKDEQNSEERRV